MNSTIQIRPARPEDKGEIIAFCQNTFSWGDYIADVWDDWISDRASSLIIAVSGHRPVGLLHVALLDQDVAWMEGMRVHPDYRRQSIGIRLDQAGREFAREHGRSILRLATANENIPAQHVLQHQGYTRIARYNSWSTTPAADDAAELGSAEASSDGWRIARHGDEKDLLALWASPGHRPLGPALLPTSHWTWTELTDQRLHDHVQAAEVRIQPDGFAIVIEDNDEHWCAIDVLAFVGEGKAIVSLARNTRAEASYRGFPRVQARILDDVRLNNMLEGSGYVQNGAVLIFEQRL